MKNLYNRVVKSKICQIPLKMVCGFLIVVVFSLTLGKPNLLNAQTPSPLPRSNAAIYHFKIGEWNGMSVCDGKLSFSPTFFVPNANPTEIAASLTENFLPTEELSIYVNVLYLDTGSHKVLIDTGVGKTGQDTAGQVVTNLESSGVRAEDIDTVIITHAHPDHIGGLTTKTGELNFPNAQYYLSENEWNFWTASTVEMPNSLLNEEDKQQMINAIEPQLQAIANRIVLFQPGDELIPGIEAIDVSGHTPGQSAYLISSGNEQLVVTGDVFYSDPLNLEHPDWEVRFDVDPKLGVATRERVLKEFNSDRGLLLVPHMPFPGLGHVDARSDHYEWKPIQWQFEPS